MLNSTTNTYQMKREILNYSNKISKHLSKPDKKFSADMTYGMLAAGSCLLTDVVDQFHENTKKVNSVERLTRHLNNGTSSTALKSYLTTIRKCVPATQLRNQRKGKIKTALNFYITLGMAFLAHMSMKSETHALKASIIQKADPIKEKVHFSYYRLAKGICGILSYAKEVIRPWFRINRPAYCQLCLRLIIGV